MLDDEGSYDAGETPKAAVRKAVRFWGEPQLAPTTRKGLERYAERGRRGRDRRLAAGDLQALRQNALRMLIATSPEMQTC